MATTLRPEARASSHGATARAESEECRDLREFIARDLPIPVACIDELLAATDAKPIKKLGVKVKGDKADSLAPLARLTALQELRIEGESVTRFWLWPLRKLSSLRSLSVEGPVTFNAIADVSPQLEHVGASRANDTEELSRFPHLSSTLTGCLEPGGLIDAPTLRSVGVECYGDQYPFTRVNGCTVLTVAPLLGDFFSS